MPCNLKAYIKERTDSPDFLKIFREECCICSFTLKIQQKFDNSHFNRDMVLKDLGYALTDLDNLLSGESCNPELAYSLGDFLNIDKPGSCLKTGGKTV